ncbi:MAG: hypothetical protein ACK5KO_04585 [Arachnia sp.]
MLEPILIVIVVLFVAVLAGGIWTNSLAKRQHRVHTTLAPDQAETLVLRSFTPLLWAVTSGPGDINRRRRQFQVSLTVSVDIEPAADGGTDVHAWVSHADKTMGLIMGRGAMMPQSIAKRIQAADSSASIATS